MVGWKVGEGGPRQGGWQKIEEAYSPYPSSSNNFSKRIISRWIRSWQIFFPVLESTTAKNVQTWPTFKLMVALSVRLDINFLIYRYLTTVRPVEQCNQSTITSPSTTDKTVETLLSKPIRNAFHQP